MSMSKSRTDPTRLLADLMARNPNLTREELRDAFFDFIKSPEGAAYKEAVMDEVEEAMYNKVMKERAARPKLAAQRAAAKKKKRT
jgi:hypothetical protein